MIESTHRPRDRNPATDEDRKSVLVVDDDLPLRGMLSSALRRNGYQVFLAGDGGEAHRAMLLNRPHVILLDLMMPGVNGWDFLQKLRDSGHLGQVPVIVISAHLREDPQAVLEMGVAAILPKPFNLEELLEMVHHLAR
ncbi:MAG: response regulator transcription factor [Thermoanaerobaculia bacterium]